MNGSMSEWIIHIIINDLMCATLRQIVSMCYNATPQIFLIKQPQ